MKTLKTRLVIILMTLSVSLNACVESDNDRFNARKFVKNYKDSEHVISFNLPPALLRVFVDSDEKELKELLKHVDDMRFLIFEDEYFSNTSPNKLFDEMEKELKANNFHDLMVVKEKGEMVKFKIQESDGIVSELIMLVASHDGVVVMNISGDIKLKDINLITESIDIHKVHDFE